MGTAVPVQDETREKLRSITAKYECTYDELINQLVESSDIDTLELEQAESSRYGGSSKKVRSDEAIEELLLTNDVEKRILEKAMDIVDASYSNGNLLMCHPQSLAAAAEYTARLLLNKNTTQKKVADKYDVSKLTIRENYKVMCEDYLE